MHDHIIKHWQDLRGRTYDLLDVLEASDLPETLPFPESATLYNQLWCMLGTTESFAKRIAAGSWQGWSSSLTSKPPDVTIDMIRDHLKKSDDILFDALKKHDNLLTAYDDGTTPLRHYFRLVEHESHHHGQLINFIFALHLPIPQSWADEWALSR